LLDPENCEEVKDTALGTSLPTFCSSYHISTEFQCSRDATIAVLWPNNNFIATVNGPKKR
jgi:hypothetical protein